MALSRAGQLIERANALAAGRSGAGNISPQDWQKVWLQSFSLNPDQAAKAHGLSSSFFAERGRAPDEGEVDDIFGQVTSGRLAGTNPNPGQGAQVPVTRTAQGMNPWPLGYIPGETHGQQYGLTPQQMTYLADQAANFTRQRGRTPDTGEFQDLIADARMRGGPGVAAAATTERKVAKPWQVNPAVWDSLGVMGRQLALGFAEDEGWDAGDYEAQINATRPMGSAPRSVLTQYQAPQRRY